MVGILYFSPKEFQNYYSRWLGTPNKREIIHRHGLLDLVRKKNSAEWHIKYLCNNILHFIKTGQKAVGERAWDMICIGSDNDGAINTIRHCKTAADFPKLHDGLLKFLPEMAEEAGIRINNLKEKVSKIMYQNALDFLKQHYV